MENPNDKSLQKAEFPFTVVQIKSLEDDKCTTIRIIDSKYSVNGEIVKVEELPSFEGECALIYNSMVAHYIKLAKDVEESVKSGRIC